MMIQRLLLVSFLALPASSLPRVTAIVSSATFNRPETVAPRSLITIFGEDLAPRTATPDDISGGLPRELAGVQVLLVAAREERRSNTCEESGDPRNTNVWCEVTAGLYFVSPGQVNLMVPDSYFRGEVAVILMKDGVRYEDLGSPRDAWFYMAGPQGSQRFIFEVGWDCPFGSLDESIPCGYYAVQIAENQVVVGAITDTKGSLITTDTPVHAGQMLTIWASGLGHKQLSDSGLLEVEDSVEVRFGVIPTEEAWQAIPGHQFYNRLNGIAYFERPEFAGESPQFPGLDQINVRFRGCTTGVDIGAGERFDVTLNIGASNTVTLPYQREGEPGC